MTQKYLQVIFFIPLHRCLNSSSTFNVPDNCLEACFPVKRRNYLHRTSRGKRISRADMEIGWALVSPPHPLIVASDSKKTVEKPAALFCLEGDLTGECNSAAVQDSKPRPCPPTVSVGCQGRWRSKGRYRSSDSSVIPLMSFPSTRHPSSFSPCSSHISIAQNSWSVCAYFSRLIGSCCPFVH